MLDFIRDLVRKEKPAYIFKEYQIKNKLGWYYVSFLCRDDSIRTFSCWYNTTSVGKNPLSLLNPNNKVTDLTLEMIGDYCKVSTYADTKRTMPDMDTIMRAEAELSSYVTNLIVRQLPNELDWDIEVITSFDPTVSMILRIKEDDSLIGNILCVENQIIPVGVCATKIYEYIALIEEVFGSGRWFYQICG